jgi:hypothetical protein
MSRVALGIFLKHVKKYRVLEAWIESGCDKRIGFRRTGWSPQ